MQLAHLGRASKYRTSLPSLVKHAPASNGDMPQGGFNDLDGADITDLDPIFIAEPLPT